MRVDLREPLAADGGTLELKIDWSFVVPEYGADRMGRLAVEGGTVYELAQWYPRMVVFDDVNGWNALPYLGQGEFYLQFGTFEVAITVQIVKAGPFADVEVLEAVAAPDELRGLRSPHIFQKDELARPFLNEEVQVAVAVDVDELRAGHDEAAQKGVVHRQPVGGDHRKGRDLALERIGERTDLGHAIRRTGVGFELKNRVSLGGFPLVHALGVAQRWRDLGETVEWDAIDLYYRVQATLPF